MSDINDNINTEDSNYLTKVGGMYKEWFLDYASYVILERAVPDLMDGLKPVQRRILHSMFDLEDGRYNKVCLLYTSPSPRDTEVSRMPSSA